MQREQKYEEMKQKPKRYQQTNTEHDGKYARLCDFKKHHVCALKFVKCEWQCERNSIFDQTLVPGDRYRVLKVWALDREMVHKSKSLSTGSISTMFIQHAVNWELQMWQQRSLCQKRKKKALFFCLSLAFIYKTLYVYIFQILIWSNAINFSTTIFESYKNIIITKTKIWQYTEERYSMPIYYSCSLFLIAAPLFICSSVLLLSALLYSTIH